MNNKITIPRHESEVIAADKRRRRGVSDKVATTALSEVNVHGVLLFSRYSKAHEFEAMASMVDQLPSSDRAKVYSIFCDSKAECCYSVTMNACTKSSAEAIGRRLESASRGHNGIDISGPAGSTMYLDPYWPGDDYGGNLGSE